MSVNSLIRDSLTLYKDGRYISSLCLAMIAIDATAHKRYGNKESSNYISSSSLRFKRFLNDETKPTNMMMRIHHGVDLPPQPNLGERPRYKPPSNPDDLVEMQNTFEEFKKAITEWDAKHASAYKEYDKQIISAGDNFKGKNEPTKNPGKSKGKWVSYLGKPRMVSTTGILYQVRCELIHEGAITTIRMNQNQEDSNLWVKGIDPIELSHTWIPFILGMVDVAKENQGIQT